MDAQEVVGVQAAFERGKILLIEIISIPDMNAARQFAGIDGGVLGLPRPYI